MKQGPGSRAFEGESQPVRLSRTSPTLHLVWALSIAILFVFSLFWLPQHADQLFNRLDGAYMRMTVAHQWQYTPRNLGFALNLMSGAGSLIYPSNMPLVSVYVVQLWLTDAIDPVMTYAIVGAFMLAATYLWARMADLDAWMGIVAGWLTAILALPYLPEHMLVPNFQLVPHWGNLLFFSTIFLYCLSRVTTAVSLPNAICLFFVTLTPAYIVLSDPLNSPIVVPVTALFALYLALRSTEKAVLAVRIAALALAVLVVVAGGVLTFLYGNTMHAAAAYFHAEYVRTAGTSLDISVLFQTHYPVGMFLVPLSVAGAILAVWDRGKERRAFALMFLFTTALLLAVSFLLTYVIETWRGPQGYYFETALWPLYVIYSVLLLQRAFRALHSWIVRRRLVPATRSGTNDFEWFRLPTAWSTPVMMALYATLVPPVVLAIFFAGSSTTRPPNYPYPPDETPIIRHLVENAAVELGKPFRGYTATFTGSEIDHDGVDWRDLHAFDRAELVKTIGNDHRFVGLWYHRIPTINEYSQHISAPLYLVASRLLTRPKDEEVRNILLLTAPDFDLLQMLGTRYVISDRVLRAPAEQRETLAVGDTVTLRLYELPHPNLATYSPTNVRRVDNAADAMAVMAGPFDFRTDVLLTVPQSEPLVEASTQAFEVTLDGVRVSAESAGPSLLLLPIQYSHCLEPVFDGNRPEGFAILRANIVSTAIRFDGRLDVKLVSRNGPFLNSLCRLRDIEDLRRLRLADVPRRIASSRH